MSNPFALPSLPAQHNHTVNQSLPTASQTDTDPSTRHDSERCVPQALVAAAVLAGSEATRSLLQGLQVPEAGTRQREMYDSIAADYVDGVLTTQSLRRVGDLIHDTQSAPSYGTDANEFRAMLERSGATVSRPWDVHQLYPVSVLDQLQPGEFALVGRSAGYGTGQHAIIVTRHPGKTNRWIVFDPARTQAMRTNLSRDELDRAMAPNVLGRVIGNGDVMGVYGTFHW